MDDHTGQELGLVEERTRDLSRSVNLMAGREVRMADLKEINAALEKQLQAAGITPDVTEASFRRR